MVFEKFESWSWSAPPPAELFAKAWEFWGHRGYELTSTGGTSFRGRSFQSRIGIHRVVDVTVVPTPAGSVLQLRFRADVRADVAAGGAVLAVVLLPLAVVGAAVSWHEYESDWSRERWEFWNYLVALPGARVAEGGGGPPPPTAPLFDPGPPVAPPGGATGTPPASAELRCPQCHAVATGERRFCASCGAPIPGPGTA